MTETFVPSLPDGVEAALYFADGGDQYVFCWRERTGSVSTKALAPAAVRAAFEHEPIDSGWLPLNIRRWGNGAHGVWVAAFYPPAVYRLPFVNDFARALSDEKIVTLAVPLPGLVALGTGRGLYVWAVGQDFSPDAMLFHAPLPNVDSNGQVCLGSNQYPRLTSKEGFEQLWRLFLTSPFNDHSRGEKSRLYPGDVRLQLLALAKARRRKYPLRDLVTTGSTVDRTVQGILYREKHSL